MGSESRQRSPLGLLDCSLSKLSDTCITEQMLALNENMSAQHLVWVLIIHCCVTIKAPGNSSKQCTLIISNRNPSLTVECFGLHAL